MSGSPAYRADVVIAGGGLAGLVTAFELLDSGNRVVLVDKDRRENLGGLAKESSGGVFMVGTPHQRRLGIEDSPELAWNDWQRVAEYEAHDQWPRRWGEFFCENSHEYVFEFFRDRKLKFLPMVMWAERGARHPGNSVPRFHMAWGLGSELAARVLSALDRHERRSELQILCETEISDIEVAAGRVVGVRGSSVADGREVRIDAPHVVIASGGICGGDLSTVRAHWSAGWGPAPETLLNGGHVYSDGLLHNVVATAGGAVTHLDLHWHYATGVHNPAKRRPNDGLSLVPPRSALWLDARGARIMTPDPMLAYGDTRDLVAAVLGSPGQYSWQVMNRRIAERELSASGTSYLTAFREKSWLRVAATALFGNKADTTRLLRDCAEDIVVADSLDDLIDGMQRKSLQGLQVDRAQVRETITKWDAMIERGATFAEDEQLRHIARCRAYRGDRMRTCNFQRILDPNAGPLVAIREFVLARKSLGGIQTDLQCRVLRAGDGEPIPGLYAVGEAAGFGGGGVHGKRSLEGTFLAGCVLTGRAAGRSIARLHSSS